jgi:beta-N-acetylhexosaminidase
VRRLPAPALALPPMRRLGQHGDPELARRVGSVLGRELSALGFNLDFAPVLDVDSNPKNPIIGDRAFSDDPNQVARLARAFARGLNDAGVLACGKHFPGHGDTDRDSHLDLPVVRHDRKHLDAVELPPFRAASHAGLPALMTAHVVYEGLDPGVVATLSHKISTQLLRSELGFGGVLFSDDLEMKAVADRYPIGKIAVAAIAAGCDALLVCKDPERAAQAHDALTERAEHDDAFAARCRQALGRCLTARRQHPPRPVPDFAQVTALLEGPDVTALKAELEALE